MKNKSYKISVAMCTYNGEKFINEQLESIVKQSRQPDELIICDDKSSDRTIEIINEFKKGVSFNVKLIINSKRLGVSKNFEKAILNCTGDIILFSDQDDVWMENKISKIEKQFINNGNIALVYTNALLVDENLANLGYTLWDSLNFKKKDQDRFLKDPIKVLIKRNVVTGATMALNANYIKSITPIPEIWIHDYWIAILLAIRNKKNISLINEPLIKYRQHSNNQIGASKTTLLHKASLIKKYPNKYNVENYERYDYLIDKLKKCNYQVENRILKLLKAKRLHLYRRVNLTSNICIRLFTVLKDTMCFRYMNYSNGIRSIIKDIFFHQPKNTNRTR